MDVPTFTRSIPDWNVMSKSKLKSTTAIPAEITDAITDDMMADLEAAFKTAEATTAKAEDATKADKAAHAAFLYKALYYGSQARTDADKTKINKTLDNCHGMTRDGKSKALKTKQSQVIFHPETHKMLAANNGGKAPTSPEQVKTSLAYVDNKTGKNRTHTMRSLMDGSPNSPIVKARTAKREQASADSYPDRYNAVRSNPTTGPVLAVMIEQANVLLKAKVLRDTTKDGENRSPYEAFVVEIVELLHALIDVE